MNFQELSVAGAHLIGVERLVDDRGLFARVWCAREFAARGLAAEMVQSSQVYTRSQGTLRGLHFQIAPHEEAKLVRCVRGKAFVAIVDLRAASPTYLRSLGVELSADTWQSLYVPPGCAQGYQTLADDTEMLYQMSEFYAPEAARGVRHDDRAFSIEWPLKVTVISAKDRSWPDYVSVDPSRPHYTEAVCRPAPRRIVIHDAR